jgi:hypothetical protein
MLITGSREGWENFFKLRCPQYQLLDEEGNNIKEYVRSKKDWCNIMNSKASVIHYVTDYSELDWLKINKGQAEIHMMQLAECIYDAVNKSTPKVLIPGEWHIPFLDKIETDFEEIAVKVSTAMAARTSYTVVGNEKEIDIDAMVALHDRLLSQDPPHSSPLEHCAKAMSKEERMMYRKIERPKSDLEGLGWCNNLKGFIPYRYMVDNGNQTSKD